MLLSLFLYIFAPIAAVTSSSAWTQGYLAEYFHQCEPGSFVDQQMKDDVFEPEVVCENLDKNGCHTPNLDFTNGKTTCKAWRGTHCGFEGGFPGVKIPDEFSARYTGKLKIPSTGTYEFCLDR